MTDLLVTGAYGQLGRAVLAAAAARRLTALGHDLDTLDITDGEAVSRALESTRPAAVVNCAAFTAVDACETDEATAMRVNSQAVGHLAGACDRLGVRLLHVSTDYVFSGDGDRPYREDDPVGPRSAYGRSKLAGELAAAAARHHLVVRTAWLYGHGGQSFVEAIRRQLAAGVDPLRVVADQFGSPTFCDDLAEALLDLDRTGATGIVHAVNEGHVSWHGFAREIVRRLGSTTEVVPVRTADFPRPAPRPAWSVLSTDRLAVLLGRRLPPWPDALGRYLEGTCAT